MGVNKEVEDDIMTHISCTTTSNTAAAMHVQFVFALVSRLAALETARYARMQGQCP